MLSISLNKSLTRLRANSISFSYLFVFVFFLELWQWRLTHIFSLPSVATFTILGGLCLIYGRIFLQMAPFSFKASCQYSLQLLFGFFILCTMLFVMIVTTSLAITTSCYILCAGGLLLALFFPRAVTVDNSLKLEDRLPDFLCLLLSGVAATLWCTDALNGPTSDNQLTIFPLWQDSFFHARLISAFAHAEGLHSISNLLMAEAPMKIYHYANYVPSAVVLAFTHVKALEVFASFLVPFGLFLSGLAAFSLASTLWGVWPGVAATVAVLLLPDAYQQGFSNKFLSYYFLQQVGPGGLYGVSCIAIAWMLILDSCKSGKRMAVGLGYAFLVISLVYKSHLFVANAFLIMIYPCFFFPRLQFRWRMILLGLFTALFVTVITISQHSPSIPILRLDGSSMHAYAKMLLSSTDLGMLRSLFVTQLINHHLSVPLFIAVMSMMVLICTFGAWCPLWMIATISLRHKESISVLAFPLLVITNYLVMSLGLAFDTKEVGMPEELIHRPFVWAYFALVVWTSAAIYFLFFGNHPPKSLRAQLVASLLLLATIGVPFYFSFGIQTMPIWGISSTWNAVPTDLVKASYYIQDHSNPYDVVQDAEGDPKLAVTGLSEQQCYAFKGPMGTTNSLQGLQERLIELDAFQKMTTEEEIQTFLRSHAISWYILHPETKVAWPASFKDKTSFCSGEYRVYHF